MVRTFGSKNKNGYNMSEKAQRQRELAPLKDGKHSEKFNKFLESKGFKEIDNFIEVYKEDLQNSLELIKKRDEIHNLLFETYASTGARGLDLRDQLLEVDTLLLKLKEDLLMEGKNPLLSKEYMKAMELKMQLRKELDRLDFDKKKAIMEQTRRDSKSGENEDVVFDASVFEGVE